jgi:hypothetical protein
MSGDDWEDVLELTGEGVGVVMWADDEADPED